MAKRFNNVGGYLYDGNTTIGHYEDLKFREDFVSIINDLHEENELLKFQNEQLKNENKEMQDYLARLEEELRNLRRLSNELYMEKGE